jgi:hypothetical protein
MACREVSGRNMGSEAVLERRQGGGGGWVSGRRRECGRGWQSKRG